MFWKTKLRTLGPEVVVEVEAEIEIETGIGIEKMIDTERGITDVQDREVEVENGIDGQGQEIVIEIVVEITVTDQIEIREIGVDRENEGITKNRANDLGLDPENADTLNPKRSRKPTNDGNQDLTLTKVIVRNRQNVRFHDQNLGPPS